MRSVSSFNFKVSTSFVVFINVCVRARNANKSRC